MRLPGARHVEYPVTGKSQNKYLVRKTYGRKFWFRIQAGA